MTTQRWTTSSPVYRHSRCARAEAATTFSGVTRSAARARNAGLLAVRILAATDPALRERMTRFQADLERSVLDKDAALRARTAR